MTNERRRALRRAWAAATLGFGCALLIPFAGPLGALWLWSVVAVPLWHASTPERYWTRLVGSAATLFVAVGVQVSLWTLDTRGYHLPARLTSALASVLVASLFLWPLIKAIWAWRLLMPHPVPARDLAPAP